MTLKLDEVMTEWSRRVAGQRSIKWELDDLWSAACWIASEREASSLGQRDAAAQHRERAQKDLDRYNALRSL